MYRVGDPRDKTREPRIRHTHALRGIRSIAAPLYSSTETRVIMEKGCDYRGPGVSACDSYIEKRLNAELRGAEQDPGFVMLRRLYRHGSLLRAVTGTSFQNGTARHVKRLPYAAQIRLLRRVLVTSTDISTTSRSRLHLISQPAATQIPQLL
jgi:hypothetical protein